MYCIAWKSKITGATGFGTGLFSYDEAEKIADQLNKEKDAICIHWPELERRPIEKRPNLARKL